MQSPEEHRQRAASSPSPMLLLFPVAVLKTFLFLPPSPSFPSIPGERWHRLSAQPCRPPKGGPAGSRGAEGALTDRADNHCNKCRVRKEGGKQLFPKCHRSRLCQRPPLG
ncbi:unnamed protein product [Pleuronectes platessa]|uniref:Uncharacterized protein n=1 Tax=Pleuronectes platessa TaxID=8262 RepID=A0A9N7TMA0_PLEPL|nr:unnamed protein product [Pleuronectes platessa]